MEGVEEVVKTLRWIKNNNNLKKTNNARYSLDKKIIIITPYKARVDYFLICFAVNSLNNKVVPATAGRLVCVRGAAAVCACLLDDLIRSVVRGKDATQIAAQTDAIAAQAAINRSLSRVKFERDHLSGGLTIKTRRKPAPGRLQSATAGSSWLPPTV